MKYSKQFVFCMCCGKEFETTFDMFKGTVCSMNCFKEIEWRKILSMLGKEYEIDPKAGTYEKKN